jgi:hypothetical protein
MCSSTGSERFSAASPQGAEVAARSGFGENVQNQVDEALRICIHFIPRKAATGTQTVLKTQIVILYRNADRTWLRIFVNGNSAKIVHGNHCSARPVP